MLPSISAPGDFFLNSDGTEFHYVGYSEFALPKRFYTMENGPEALVRPLLIERRQIADRAGWTGPLVARSFRYADPGNAFGILPKAFPYSRINELLDMAAEYRIYLDITTGDSQKTYMIPEPLDQQIDLDRFSAAIQRFCFLETCNEPFKNGWLPQNGVKPAPSQWYLRDSGNYVYISDTQPWEFWLDLDFVSGHFSRTNEYPRWPKWVCDLDDSLATLRRVVKKASVLKEPNKFGVYYDDPAQARILGLRANMGGVVFHSQKGLESNGFDDATKEAFYQFCRGAVGAVQP